MESQRPASDDPDAWAAKSTLWFGCSELSFRRIIRRRKRRLEVAELRQALVDKHSTGIIYVVWDNASTRQADEVEAIVRAAAGRLVLLYLPTYSPWLTPIEMLWRHFRREVTHCEIFATVKILIEASYSFFNRYNKHPKDVLSIIGVFPS